MGKFRDEEFFTSFGKISYWQKSGEPNYLFIHGLACDKTHFSLVFDHPAAFGKGIVCVDLLGHGLSDQICKDRNYSIELQAQAVNELLIELDVGKVTVVLHSMASTLLPAFAKIGHPNIRAIYLLEGNLVPEDAEWSKWLSSMQDEQLSRYVRKFKDHAQFVLKKNMHREYPRSVISRWSECFRSADPRIFREMGRDVYEITRNRGVQSALREFNGPKIYIRGSAESDWAGASMMKDLDVRLLEIENAGHYLMLDAPEPIYDVVFAD